MSFSLQQNQRPPVASEGTGTSPAPQAQTRVRSMLIDVVRGIAIFLVAFGHSNQGVQHRGWWGASLTGLRIDAAIYAFHMPAFFFVSGIFLKSSIEKRGVPRFIRDKLRSMIWPYLVFSVLSFVVLHFVSHLTVQKAPGFPDFLRLLITGQISWFLPTIFITVLLGMCGRRLPTPLFFVIAAALSFFCPELPLGVVMVAIRFLPFLVLGMWVSFAYENLERIPPVIAAAGGLLLAIFISFLTWNLVPRVGWRFVGLGIAGTLMLLLFARVLGRGSLARTFAWLGEASFGIFLLSAFAQGFGRELILRLTHLTNPWVQSLGQTIFAVTIPAWIYANRQRLHIAWMFVFPLKDQPRPAS